MMGTLIIIITRIPITATELFIRFILPSKEEYASLIDEPTTGISEPIRKRMPFTEMLSTDAESILFMLRKPENKDAASPKTVLRILFIADINLGTFMLLLSENDTLIQKNAPKKSVTPDDIMYEINSAKDIIKVLYVKAVAGLPLRDIIRV